MLAIDGGGVLGLAPAVLLAELERRTGRRVCGLFDLVVGTSVGGIVALAVTKPGPLEAGAAVEMFLSRSRRMFRRRPPAIRRAVRGPTYDAASMAAVLREVFGEATLAEAMVPVAVTAYDLTLRRPVLLRSAGCAMPMHATALATASAPTYFEPATLPDGRTMIDGGVALCNPAMAAYAEAISMFSGRDVVLVSLGTGSSARPIDAAKAKRWGKVSWVCPLLEILMNGSSSAVHEELTTILGGERKPSSENWATKGKATKGRRYWRFDIDLGEYPEVSRRMDDTRRKNLAAIEAMAKRVAVVRSAELDELAAILAG